MKAINLTTLSALILVAPLTAVAQPAAQTSTASGFDDRFYISPFATYTWADSSREVDNNWGFGLGFGKPLNEWLNLELRATHTEFTNNFKNLPGWAIDGKNKVTDVGVDGLFFFSRGKFQPFLLAGVGAIQDNYKLCVNGWCDSASRWGFMAEAGLGFMVPVTDYVAFRVDGRYRYDGNRSPFTDSSSMGDVMVTAGVVISLGQRAAPPAPKVTKTYELSADALFDFDKYSLKPTGRTTIDNFSSELNQFNYDSIRVAGHTDPIGSQEYNLALSDRRANTVREELVNRGVAGDRITAQGYGKSNLKVTPADCAHAKSRAALIECYQPNRRVDVAVEGVAPKE